MVTVTKTTLYKNGDISQLAFANAIADPIAIVYFDINDRSEYSIEVARGVTDWIDGSTALALSEDLLRIVKHCDFIAEKITEELRTPVF